MIWTVIQIVIFIILNLPGMVKAIRDLFHMSDGKPAGPQAFVKDFHAQISQLKAAGIKLTPDGGASGSADGRMG